MKGRLNITAPPGFGRVYLVPIAHSFTILHPDLQIDLKFQNETVDLISNRLDMAVRIGMLRDSGLIATRIGAARRLLVASPDYLRHKKAISAPSDLGSYNCLIESHLTAKPKWLFRRTSGTDFEAVSVSGTVAANDTEALYLSALEGKGVALLPDWYALQGVKAGNLILLLRDWKADLFSHPRGIYAVFPSVEYTLTNPREFIVFLRRKLSRL